MSDANESVQEQPTREHLRVDQLDFDPQNPRFPAEIARGPAQDLVERFVRDERLAEVLSSIADQGYFEGEPLLVVKHGEDRYFVVEGNRRLAALKLLTRELAVPEGRISISDICDHARHRPSEVPCLIFTSAARTMRYLGFRHITGIKSWSSLQKARYLKHMRDQFYLGLGGREQMKTLAREIGSRADYVGSMLAALNLYERAESSAFYEVHGLVPEEIDFSVLTTALSYTNIASYVGLEDRQDSVGAQVSDENLKQLLSWMFVARGNQKSVLGDSRNLKSLAAVVESKAATRMLVESGDLEAAFQLSRGPAVALNLALKAIDRKLQDVWKWLPQVENPDPKDEEIAEGIRRQAQLIRDTIRSTRASNTDE